MRDLARRMAITKIREEQFLNTFEDSLDANIQTEELAGQHDSFSAEIGDWFDERVDSEIFYGITGANEQFQDQSFPDSGVFRPDFNDLNIERTPTDLEEKLLIWSMDNCISENSMTKLYGIMAEYSHQPISLPTHFRVTMRRYLHGKAKFSLDSANFLYIGLAHTLNELHLRDPGAFLCLHERSEPLILNFNTDGLTFCHSSSSQFWPILMCTNINTELVSVVALYWSKKHHPDPETLLKKFVDDLTVHLFNGFQFQDHTSGEMLHVQVQFGLFVADCPAMALIKCTVGHTGFNSCFKCNITGVSSVHNKRIRAFVPDEAVDRLRSDEVFRKLDETHQNALSPLVNVQPPLHMINDFVIDGMHSVYLGVVRRQGEYWQGKYSLLEEEPKELCNKAPTKATKTSKSKSKQAVEVNREIFFSFVQHIM